MRRKLAWGLFICLMAICLSACTQVQDNDFSYPVYESYADIPGVTENEIVAIEALKLRRDGFTVSMNHSTEAFYREDGTIGGFTALFCEWLTDLFGIPFTPIINEWDALIEGLSAKEIDFTGELTATPERRKTYYMTDAIAERSVKYFRLEGSEKLSTIADERELHYAFLDGATTSEYVQEMADEEFTVTYIGDYDEAVCLLRSGEIDAFFDEGTAEAGFDQYGDIVTAEYFPLIYTPVSLSTGNQELVAIIDVMQKYLNAGAAYQLTTLYNAGEKEYREHKLYIQLSDEEKAYLTEHTGGKNVLIAIEYDNYPMSFYNQTEGEWQGIAIDVLAEVSELTGLVFAPYNEPGTPWAELLDALEKNEVSLISELIPSQEREGQFLWPDDPYCVDNFALISLTEQENIKVNQILYSSVAIAEETAYQEIFERWFPSHPHTVLYPSTDECFLALEAGEVDFVMASRNLMLSMTNYSEKPGFKVNMLFSNTYESSFGLNINEALLCSILSKTQRLIDMESITEHWTHRVFDYRAKLVSSRMPYLIGVAILLAVVLALLFILLLRHRKSGRQLEKLVDLRTSELVIQTQAAQEASRAKSEFLSRMSHEIRTPLNAIIGMAQITRQVPELPEKAAMTNDEILTASNHLLGILNDILDMAKIESGKFALVDEPFALRPAMEEVAQLIEQRCKEKELHFITNISDIPDIGVSGDKLRLKQVLINLLGNAVKFTDAGGDVRFTVDRKAESADRIELNFAVKDNGIGMTVEQVQRLFTAFEQADTSIAVKYGGTGLGLSISQNMVRQMGGEIFVSSEPGKGSSFHFTIALPIAAVVNEERVSQTAPDLRAHTILLAEDVDINRLILSELLSDTNIMIEEAVNGEEAVSAFRNAPPGHYSLIFMDVQMPVLDGYAATRAIRALPRADAKTIPIIAMTANAYKEDIDRAIESGMDGHIAKPVDIDIVWETLRKYLK